MKINLGCGIYCAKDWVNVDKFFTEDELKNHLGGCKNSVFEDGAVFIQADVIKLPFEDNSADLVEAKEVLEHLSIYDIVTALVEIRRVLKPGGILRASSPCFDGLVQDWLSLMLWPEFDPKRWFDVAQTIYGNQAHEGEYHRIPLNQPSMNYLLAQAGFTDGLVGIFRAGSPAKEFEAKFELNTPEQFMKKGKRVLRNDTLFIEVTK